MMREMVAGARVGLAFLAYEANVVPFHYPAIELNADGTYRLSYDKMPGYQPNTNTLEPRTPRPQVASRIRPASILE